jgi:hypothetical protein
MSASYRVLGQLAMRNANLEYALWGYPHAPELSTFFRTGPSDRLLTGPLRSSGVNWLLQRVQQRRE